MGLKLAQEDNWDTWNDEKQGEQSAFTEFKESRIYFLYTKWMRQWNWLKIKGNINELE